MPINIKNLNFSFNETKIFENFSLEISSGEITTILGPSGCGKTTLLNIISNILHPHSSEISVPNDQVLSLIFQEARLLPWLNVLENILFAIEDKNRTSLNRALHYLKEMGLEQHKNKYPGQLSGGMSQRVSIARAFTYPSNTILMDEPFKGLDFQLKLNILNLFNKLWSEDNRTAVFVTHDVLESLLIGDNIVILKGTPANIHKTIKNPIPKSERTLDNLELLSIEKKLYKTLSQL